MAAAPAAPKIPTPRLPADFCVVPLEGIVDNSPNRCDFPPHLGDDIGAFLGGSTGAWRKNGPDGHKFVVKRGASIRQLLVEYDAARIYRAIGMSVPDCRLYTQDGRRVAENAPLESAFLLLDFADGKILRLCDAGERAAAYARLRRGFAVDALLGNWDVIGLELDNIIVLPGGEAVRIDQGGTFELRAQGGNKPAAVWGPQVKELDSMRNAAQAKEAAPVFTAVTPDELSQQCYELVCVHRTAINQCLIHCPVRRSLMDARLVHLMLEWLLRGSGLPAVLRFSFALDSVLEAPEERVPGAVWVACNLLRHRDYNEEFRMYMDKAVRRFRRDLPAGCSKTFLVDMLVSAVAQPGRIDTTLVESELFVDACADGSYGRARLFHTAGNINYRSQRDSFPLYAALSSDRTLCSELEFVETVRYLSTCCVPRPDPNMLKPAVGGKTALKAAVAYGKVDRLREALEPIRTRLVAYNASGGLAALADGASEEIVALIRQCPQ